MKKIHLYLLLLLLSAAHSGSAQNANWFRPGGLWLYSAISSLGDGCKTIKNEGAANINGQDCFKLKETTNWGWGHNDFVNINYMYEKNDSVFLTGPDSQVFYLLYDFTLQPGDTGLTHQYQDMSPVTYIVDSVGIDFGATVPIRYQIIHYADLSGGTYKVQERTGGQSLFYISAPVLEEWLNLFCYEDDTYNPGQCQPPQPPPPPPYHQMLANEPVWRESYHNWSEITFSEYKLGPDSILPNGEHIRALWYESDNASLRTFGFLTENALQQRVYFTRTQTSIFSNLNYWFPLNTKTVLYDFGVAVGDTLDWGINQGQIISAIDSVQLLDGTWRRQIHRPNETSGAGGPNSSWIEGIGGRLGLFTSYTSNWSTDTGNALLCYSEDDVLKWAWGNITSCTVGTSDQALLTGSIPLIPNPNSGQFSIELPTNLLPARIQVLDGLGKLCDAQLITQSPERITLPVSLPAGLYWLQIVSKEGDRFVKKMVLR